MSDPLISCGVDAIRQRALPGNGFANAAEGNYRSDATAWAVLALAAAGEEEDKERISLARTRLAAGQLQDGRVSLSPDHPEVYWPTPLAILAWHQSPPHQGNLGRAAQFLLQSSGRQSRADEAVKLDFRLKGWPWVEKTSSWVAPTALAIIALKTAGFGDHPRLAEARRLIRDRECLQGGWNYGNSEVYGKELRPMPEDTGLALNALKDATAKSSLERSLGYLQAAVEKLRTPFALAWSLLGLGAWNERPAAASAWLSECLGRQERYGVYDTTSLALLVVAALAPGGLESVFSRQPALNQGPAET